MSPTSRSPAILQVHDLHYAYPLPQSDGWGPWILQGVEFELARGEFVGLMGPTSAGKSTLALAAVGIVPQSTGGRIRGQVLLDGLDARHTPVPELARRAGLVFQEPESQFLMPSVREEVAFGLENLGLPREEMAEGIDWALEMVGMEGFQGRSPYHLSGGQKQRVALASVLAMKPQLLVLDEPTANLDPAGKADLYAAIDHLRQSVNTTILMISNDSEYLSRRADRILLLSGGVIALQGEPGGVFARSSELAEMGLTSPQMIRLAQGLSEQLGMDLQFPDVATAIHALKSLLAAPGEGTQP